MGTSITTWFCADLHFSHSSMLYLHPKRREAAGLTMDDVKNDKKTSTLRHDEWLMDVWNSTVKRNDNIYILGDFCLGNRDRTEQILNKLKGNKYLIVGNHDKSCKGLERYFEWVGDIKEAKFNRNQYDFIDPKETFCIELCHFPMLAWNRRPHGTCHLHGHCHNSITNFNNQSKELRLDVGLDSDFANLGLVNLEQVYGHMRKIVVDGGCNTFKDYIEKLMAEQGFRA